MSQNSINNQPKNSTEGLVSAEKEKGRRSNRLINEQSPYLLQHAFNPVDWYPWGEEAFQEAKKQDKPLLLYFATSGADGIFSIEKRDKIYPISAFRTQWFACESSGSCMDIQ